MSMVAFRTFGVEQNVSTDWFGSVAATCVGGEAAHRR